VKVGQIWWLPDGESGFPGGKTRYCLIVAIEKNPSNPRANRAHFVVSTSKCSGTPKIVVESGEGGLRERTCYRFFWSGDMGIDRLTRIGEKKGGLSDSRRPEIAIAIQNSKLLSLKRILNS
jgi:hypothetical protein